MATIRKRGNAYQIRVSCGTDMQGKKIIESMTWKPEANMTARQIEKELNKIAVHFEENVKNGIVKKDSKIKLHELCDIYLEMQKKTLSPNSYNAYSHTIESYIKPALGHLRLADITPLHMQKFINALSEKKTLRHTTIAPSSVKSYYIVVQSIFKFACRMGFLEQNPATSTNLDFPKSPPAHTEILDEKGVKHLLECLEKEPLMWKVLIHLALCTGCRRGELAALQWDDIDWDKKQVKICKSMYHVKGETGIKLPKSRDSNRIITIPDYMLQMLKYYKNRQAEQKLIQGRDWNEHNMLFTDKNGYYISPPVISIWFSSFLERNAIPHLKFHALRHTSASILLSSGTNIKTVSSRLGHSNLTTTNRYVHALLDADIVAADTLEQKLNFTEVGQKWDKNA